MKVYRGYCFENGSRGVFVDEGGGVVRMLRPRLDLANHSPTGFAWGYGGSGPAQLALALLADALGDDELALRMYQPFKWLMIAPLPQDREWVMTEEDIRTALYSCIEVQPEEQSK